MILEYQAGAFGSELAGNGRADAAGSAGNEDDLAAEIRIHGWSRLAGGLPIRPAEAVSYRPVNEEFEQIDEHHR